METKPRLSFDDYSSAASSVIRRVTHNSTQRLSLRRTSSPSSTAPTLTPPTNEIPTSCVSRETLQNECGLHRFIVWAAVKRNSCRRMTAEERRECPLLRCRKRFANHELMLQHLYTCDQLAAAEYWCYDCEKVERFSDAKCRRCLGHPSKRRKIMSMARNFFSGLGHKNRNGHLADLDIDMDDAPPSYDSILEPSQPELSSNEIHEMASTDAAPAEDAGLDTTTTTNTTTAPEPEPEPVIEPPSPLPLDLIAPIPVSPVELDSGSIEDALINWEPSPTPPLVAPHNSSSLQPGRIRTPDKPVLQLHTSGLGQYRAKTARSKTLAPSSSVRSTCSTASNQSTLSTASYEVTPMSAWSGTWNRAPGFDSNQTSPDDLVTMDDLVPSNSFAAVAKMDVVKEKESEHDAADNFLAELPADLPMINPFPADSLIPGTLETDHSVFSFDATVPTELSIESNLALTDSANVSLDLSELLAEPSWVIGADSLVASARDALHAHLQESMIKLKHVNPSRLANEFRKMTPDGVAVAGLRTLNAVLEGNIMAATIDILCFVHLVYSLSLVVHEQDAPSRFKDLFAQAKSYSAWVPPQDVPEYCHLVECLWKPNTGSNDELNVFLQGHTLNGSQATSMSDKMRGKQPEESIPRSTPDAFLSVSQNFLDELEYAALQEANRLEILASDLNVQHLKDANLQTQPGSPLFYAIQYLLRQLCQQYSNVPGYVNSVKDLSSRVESITMRRLEIELLHAGRTFLSPAIFFVNYTNYIRSQIDTLLTETGAHFNPQLSRLSYYQQGIKLMVSLIQGPVMPPNIWENTPAGAGFESLDQFFTSITPSVGVAPALTSVQIGTLPAMETAPAAVADVTLNGATLSPTQYLPNPEATSPMGGPSAVTTSPPSPVAGSSPAKLVEADKCCEICGYRPKGDPKWFGGSMAKHKKLQHATSPPKIYRCPYPGCTSQYKNRPDNLRQHQLDKGHFVDGQEESSRRPSKRKRTK